MSAHAVGRAMPNPPTITTTTTPHPPPHPPLAHSLSHSYHHHPAVQTFSRSDPIAVVKALNERNRELLGLHHSEVSYGITNTRKTGDVKSKAHLLNENTSLRQELDDVYSLNAAIKDDRLEQREKVFSHSTRFQNMSHKNELSSLQARLETAISQHAECGKVQQRLAQEAEDARDREQRADRARLYADKKKGHMHREVGGLARTIESLKEHNAKLVAERAELDVKQAQMTEEIKSLQSTQAGLTRALAHHERTKNNELLRIESGCVTRVMLDALLECCSCVCCCCLQLLFSVVCDVCLRQRVR